jgi:hypothetical protein
MLLYIPIRLYFLAIVHTSGISKITAPEVLTVVAHKYVSLNSELYGEEKKPRLLLDLHWMTSLCCLLCILCAAIPQNKEIYLQIVRNLQNKLVYFTNANLIPLLLLILWYGFQVWKGSELILLEHSKIFIWWCRWFSHGGWLVICCLRKIQEVRKNAVGIVWKLARL